MNEKSSNYFHKEQSFEDDFSLSDDEISFLEIDMVNLGLTFDFTNTIEHEENTIGIEFSKYFNNPIDVLLISSIDNDLLKTNMSKLIDDFDIEIEIEPINRFGKKIKEYLFKVSIFKNQNLWEEYVHG